MKKKKILSWLLTVAMLLGMASALPLTASAADFTVDTADALTAALANAADGDTITLTADITGFFSYTGSAGKTVTIDGGGKTLTAPDTATGNSITLTLKGAGTVILKDLTLQGGGSTYADGVSTGLQIGDMTGGTLNIRSYGSVTAKGGAASTSYGLDNWSDGTVDVTAAYAATNMAHTVSYGVANESAGTVNVVSAEGGGTQGTGVRNSQGGTINVTTATGSLCGAINQNTGTVNVTTVTNTDTTNSLGNAIYNTSTGTVNAGTVSGGPSGVSNASTGTVNAGTITGDITNSSGGTVNTGGTAVTSVPLHTGTGISCVLDSITVAATGDTTVGALPSVYKGSDYSNTWYTDSAKTTAFSGTTVTGVTALYSSYYEAPKLAEITKNSTTTYYPTLSDALAAAADGDVIVLKEDITESVNYTVSANKTVTIDGNNHTLSGTASANSVALSLDGTGTVILKNLTLQSNASSGTSTGLDVSGSVSVQSYGTVIANGSAATATSSYGVTNSGTGTVDVTEAVASGDQVGLGAYNTGSGTINVGSATGSGHSNGAGAYNKAGGTINVTTASGNRTGVINSGSGTVNVTTATNTDAADTLGSAVHNVDTGTVNAGTASGGLHGVSNSSTGTVNAGTITGDITNSGGGAVNTGAAVTSVPLHTGTGTSCVLNSITIANSGSAIGTLPDVYKDSVCSAQWYTGISLSTAFTVHELSTEAALYSSFYTIETAEDVAAYINEVGNGLTATATGNTVTVQGTATITSKTDYAALTLNIPADVTVVWKAALSGGGNQYLLELTGNGTFEVAEGANIVNDACQFAIYCYGGTGNLIITGGQVSTTKTGGAIGIAGDWLLTMSGGEVAANAANSCAIFGKNSVVITGGTVSATGTGGCQLDMGGTLVYRSSVLDPGKIAYRTSGSTFADVSIGAAITTQAQLGSSSGLKVTGHNLPEGDSVTAVWAKQNGVSGVLICYYSGTDPKTANTTEFLAVPGVTVATACTVTFDKNGGDTDASPTTRTVLTGETVGALPTPPTRSSYNFAGWNTAPNGSGAAFTASITVKSDITVYAQWSKISDIVVPGGGGTAAPANVTITGTTTTGSDGTTTTTAQIPASGTNPSTTSHVTVALGSVTVTAPASVLSAALGSDTAGGLTFSQAPSPAATQTAVATAALSRGMTPIGFLDLNLFHVTASGASTPVHQLGGSITAVVQLTAAQLALIHGASSAHLLYFDPTGGTFTDMGATFNLTAGTVTFTTPHCSTYVIAVTDTTPPAVTGVENNGVYSTDKVVTFNKGTATLDGAAFKSGNTVSVEGKHTLIVTDAAGNVTTVTFTIDKTAPVVSGIENDGVYSADQTITFNEGTATLDDADFASGDTVSEEGTHTLVVTDAAGNVTTLDFVIDKASPAITLKSGKTPVKNGGISSGNVTVNVSDLFSVTKTVTLNGKAIAWPKNGVFTKDGKYAVTVKDQYGHISRVTFTVDKTAPKIAAKRVKGSLIVAVTEANLLSETVMLNGKKIAWPTGGKFTAKGVYVVTATDKAGHRASYTFKI